MTRDPSPEQDAIIKNADGHRIRLVSAAPGSGKTWVVARAIEHEVQGHPERHPGLAALSFTNVAKDEVLAALGGNVGSQHFVGTLDSFLYRFVLRPFLPAVADKDVVWRVIPDALAAGMKAAVFQHTVWRDNKVYATLNLFECLIAKDGMIAKHPHSGRPLELTVVEAKELRAAKRRVWFEHGLMSHSDAAYIAATLLEGDMGQAVRDLVVTRFPFLVVDELQDTGDSHSRCLRSILSDQRCRALLVGDPDQAIYEFSGASPSTFVEFGALPGAKALGLPVSRRCPSAVCRVVSALSSTGRSVLPRDDATKGRAILLIRDTSDDVGPLIASLSQSAHLLVRRNATKKEVLGAVLPEEPEFGSQPLAVLFRAVSILISGDCAMALDLAARVLANAAYGGDAPMTDPELRAHGTSRHSLRGRTMLLLLQLVPVSGEALLGWGGRARTALIQAAVELPGGKPEGKKIRGPKKGLVGEWTNEAKPTCSAVISTVHGAKGETHDTTIYYVPKAGEKTCPSEQWWPEGEERRIAFVACSRPKGTLIVCVHETSYARLLKRRPEFVELFEVVTMAEWFERESKRVRPV